MSRIHRLGVRALLACAWVVCAGCGGDDESESGGGRGSVACQDWQDAVCDWAADRCGTLEREHCDEQYRSFECRSDETASECANLFNDATCANPPVQCDFTGVADREPAIAKCNAFLDASCQYEMRCGVPGSRDECIARTKQQFGIDCDKAAAASLRYENCMETLKAATCNEASKIREACNGAIYAAG